MNLIGRDDIMDKICYLLIQQTQHIIALVGEHGVGMSSLKYLLAKRLHDDISKCNISIHHKNVIDLDIPLIREILNLGRGSPVNQTSWRLILLTY